MNDIRYWITLCETIGQTSDDDLQRKGYEDGLKGEADFAWLGTGRPNESEYWQGFDRGKASQSKQKIKMPRIAVPANLKGIRRNDLNEAFNRLIEGHATDKVQKIAAREPEEAVEAITEALNQLSKQFINGTIILYRTIEVDDPEEWVRANMVSTQNLGIFWSSNENYVMAHADDVKVLFCVEVPVQAVDWPDTIVLTVDGVEDEVRLLGGASITLKYVEPATYEFRPEPHQMA